MLDPPRGRVLNVTLEMTGALYFPSGPESAPERQKNIYFVSASLTGCGEVYASLPHSFHFHSPLGQLETTATTTGDIVSADTRCDYAVTPANFNLTSDGPGTPSYTFTDGTTVS